MYEPRIIVCNVAEVTSEVDFIESKASFAMFITQTVALLNKNFRYLWRNKCWTIVEVVLPLVFSLPLVLIVAQFFTAELSSETVFEDFEVTGDYEDLSRKVKTVKSIHDYYCNKPATVQKGDAESLMKSLEMRYIIKESPSTMNNFTAQLFDSEVELHSVLLNDTGDASCLRHYMGGLMIKTFNITARKLEYAFIFHSSSEGDASKTAWFDDDPYSLATSTIATSGGLSNYWSGGFLSIQYALDDLFIKEAITSERLMGYSLKLEKMPYPKYVSKSLTPFLGFIVYFWPLLALSNVVHGVTTIAGEKDCGMTAYLQVMGLGFPEFYLSHGIFILLKLLIIFVPCAVILLPGFVVVSGSLFLLAIVIYCLGIVCFVMLMSSLFHTSSSATKGALSAWIISIVLELMCQNQIPATDVLRCLMASLNINFAFAKTTDAIRNFMDRDLFLGFSNCFDGSYLFFTFGLGIVMMLIDIIWMTLLTIYLDNVYPPGDLPRKSVFYSCCGFKQKSVDIDYDIDEPDNNENIELEDKSRSADEPGIDVKCLTKVYEAVRAVDSLSFQAHRDNVTVLLGHNGAGKSTTFAMLTGLAAPTAGSIKICGIELGPSTLKQCQQNLGFCPQYNPIFDMLTVREHLVLCRKLKGNPQDIVDDLLNDLQLKDKANELAKNLSGGMKRKLCVAMSLVGGSKIVLLDEPTAGLDVGARSLVDDLLDKYKVGRTIILTTHYMDEADRVGDRISIMVSGRLACSGSSEFLKARFSAGYLLTIALKQHSNPANIKEQILKTVKYFVANAAVQSQTSQQLTLVLPVEHKPKFSALFEQLENSGPALSIDSFGVSLNTLEQVFLRVGELAANADTVNKDSVDVAKRQASRICDNTQRANRGFQLWAQQLGALIQKHFIYLLRKWFRFLIQFIIPLLLLLLFSYFIHRRGGPKTANINDVIAGADELAPAVILFHMEFQNRTFEKNLKRLVTKIKGFQTISLSNDSMQQYILDRPKVMPPLGMGFVSSNNFSSSMKTEVKAFFNGNARRGPIIALNTISNARLGEVSDAVVVSLKRLDYFSISSSDPFLESESDSEAVTVLIIPILIVVFSFLVSGFITQLVDEKRTNFKHQQLLTGLNPFIYWLSNYLVNSLIYMFACIVVVAIFVIYNFNVSKWVYILLALYFWASMSFICCMSFFFSSSIKAYTFMMVYTLIVPLFSLAIEKIFVFYKQSWHGFIDTTFMVLESNYALSTGLTNIISSGSQNSWNAIRFSAFMLLTSGVVFLLLLIALQTKFISSFVVRFLNSRRTKMIMPTEDVDVTDERRRLCSVPEDEFAMSVCELNKYFGSFHALKNLSFGVRTDECFGLLGANGAGKTTTFDILTGITLSDGGVAKINGQPTSKISVLGFCPQFDALLENLTARETLRLMIKLRGYTNVKERVKDVLEAISLEGNADKLVRQYSGGQRRRLSVGIALVSQGRVVLLDEPTAGIDPKARRKIWDLLSAMRDQSCAMLLTSHSMEECEALCTRIGILVRGSLAAIGAPQHIKSKFGEGYTMTIKLKDLSGREQVIQAVSDTFPNAVLKTMHPSINLVWHLQRTDKNKWSQIFEKVHRFASSRVEVADYFLAQTTLEEAFLRLSQTEDSTSTVRMDESYLTLSSLV